MDLSRGLIALGLMFLLGLLADQVGRSTRLPRVTLLLLCGVAVGTSGLNLVPAWMVTWYEPLSTVSLTMVAFLMGGALSVPALAEHGKAILWGSAAILLGTLMFVGLGLWVVGLPLGIALVLGAVATATDPAATQETIRDAKTTGGFPDTLMGIVAIDDAWGMIVFALAVVAGRALLAGQVEPDMLLHAGRDIGGALVLGVAIGLPAAFLTGRLSPGEPQQAEALGLVCLTAGLSLWLEVSYLLAGMTAGAVIVNRARHHERAFHEIENIRWPFLLLFFLLAGASLDVSALSALGLLGAVFVAMRILGRVVGGWVGAVLAGAPASERRWLGAALLPQAGVAIGMALVAAQVFPDYGQLILSLAVGTTVLFELIGPPLALLALRRVSGRKGF